MSMLKDIRVLDWSEGIAGPLACQMLGDLGADVIKVERPAGDWGRGMGPGNKEGSTHFNALNRNKRNICLDVKKEEGLKIAKSLIKSADVLITNYRPGVMEKLGLSYENISQLNPNIIYGRVSGYGYDGPLAVRAGSDTILQAVSGIMHQVGESDGVPYRVGVQIVDHTAARDLVIGVMTGLVSSLRGKRLESPIDISLFATSAALQAQQWQEYFITNKIPRRSGNRNTVLAPAGLYETSDEKHITLAILREEHWDKFCTALGRPDLLKVEEFKTNVLRLENREQLENILVPLLKSKSQEYWIEYLNEYDVLVAPVNDIGSIHADKELMSGIPLIDIPHNHFSSIYGEASKISIGLPIKFGVNTNTQARYGPPAKGEHTVEVLSELNFSAHDILKWEENKVITGV